MAVKEKTEATSEEVTEPAGDVEWGTVDNELQLLQILCVTRPIGISKYFQMACIVEKLAHNLNKDNITSKSIWDHLSTMYNFEPLEEHEQIPFPNDETDFALSSEDFGELMEGKLVKKEQQQQQPSQEAETPVKVSEKPVKKEAEQHKVKKEKSVAETPPTAESKTKGVKRTRASTAPNSDTPKVTPKRRRI